MSSADRLVRQGPTTYEAAGKCEFATDRLAFVPCNKVRMHCRLPCCQHASIGLSSSP
jgi:hypothetical protein